jgi:hypothetical protein
MDDKQIGRILRETAQLLEIDGAIIGRYRSYEKAAELIDMIVCRNRSSSLSRNRNSSKNCPESASAWSKKWQWEPAMLSGASRPTNAALLWGISYPELRRLRGVRG